jgi:hypothetical protein
MTNPPAPVLAHIDVVTKRPAVVSASVRGDAGVDAGPAAADGIAGDLGDAGKAAAAQPPAAPTMPEERSLIVRAPSTRVSIDPQVFPDGIIGPRCPTLRRAAAVHGVVETSNQIEYRQQSSAMAVSVPRETETQGRHCLGKMAVARDRQCLARTALPCSADASAGPHFGAAISGRHCP